MYPRARKTTEAREERRGTRMKTHKKNRTWVGALVTLRLVLGGAGGTGKGRGGCQGLLLLGRTHDGRHSCCFGQLRAKPRGWRRVRFRSRRRL